MDGSALFLKYPVVVARLPSEDVPSEDVCVHGTSDVVMFAVAGNDTRKCKYTISTHLRRRKREETTRALFLSLSLSLSLYSSSSLVEEENEDGDDFF